MLGSVGVYRIDGELGRGGMGVVYRATDTRLNRPVAIKALRPDLASDDASRARLRAEAMHLAALNHPNIAAIYGVEETADELLIVMEFVEGPTLTDRIWSGGSDATPLPEQDAIGIARQIAAGLTAAHAAGIVHRDLKPDNVKVRPDGLVKILDFGIASARHEEVAPDDATVVRSVEPLVVIGTPGYMSPEQLRGTRPGVESDIWAFGCLLYEMLSGTPPFRGTTTVDLAAATLMGTPDMMRIPFIARGAITACLAKEARSRPATIARALELLTSSGAHAWTPPRHELARRELLGREASIAAIAGAIAPGVPVRVVGGRGMGASCVAESGVRAWMESCGGGCCLLRLADLETAEAVLEWAGAALNLPGAMDIDLVAERFGGAADMVLLIDAEEDAAGVGRVLAAAVAAAGGRSVLVHDPGAGGRGVEAPGAGGVVVRIDGLSAPDPDGAEVTSGAARLDAARLLIARSGAPVSTRDDLRTMAKLCHAAQGSPRAIELIAAGLAPGGGAVPPARMLESIERRLWAARMDGGTLDAVRRADIITAWVVEQAGDDGRMLLCAGAAMHGAFDGGVIASILQNGSDRGAERFQQRLEQLARLGLVRRDGDSFVMPRTTRAVVRAATPPGAWDAIRRAHFLYCAAVLKRLEDGMGNRFERPLLSRLFLGRHADLLAASRWAAGRIAEAATALPADGVRAAAAAYRDGR